MVQTHTPTIIQGGMGVAVSSWWMASSVAQAGGLGVVSGTALDAVLARRLQDGDPGGHSLRALEHFPDQELVARVLKRYYKPQGRGGAPYRPQTTLTIEPNRDVIDLALAGNFVEVWLAKEGHDGPIGINFLEKIQMATPTAALGAMLADVDYVLMGAGIPREIPKLLRDLAAGRPGGVTVDVTGSSQQHMTMVDPVAALGERLPALRRPKFLAIISLHSLATYLYRDESIRPDGFVVEGPPAGGHSAPPRGRLELDADGDPIYSPRDMADLSKIHPIGLPFWVAGAHATPEAVAEVVAQGAAGVQCGTVFALSTDSGLAPELRGQLIDQLRAGVLEVRNDPRASPTGFPFKVAQVAGTVSEPETYAARPRLCDLSYLREPYRREDDSVGYRCPSEPVEVYLRKGGTLEETVGRKCLCNALMANIGLGQHRKDGYDEAPGMTLGQDLDGARRLLDLHPEGWSAAQAVSWLTSGLSPASASSAPHTAPV